MIDVRLELFQELCAIRENWWRNYAPDQSHDWSRCHLHTTWYFENLLPGGSELIKALKNAN